MRGPRAYSLRKSDRLPVVAEDTADIRSLPAPTGGWNTTSALTNMPPRDCVEIVNFWPQVATVDLREGSVAHKTGFANPVLTLMPYLGATQKLWAATDAGIYDATTAGAVGAAAMVVTEGVYSHTNFTNAGGTYLVAVNGVDTLKLYDGAAWASITGASVPAITGVTTSDLSVVEVFKRRLWFAKKNTLDVYYLPVDAIAGALALLPLAGYYKLGGYIVEIATWTVDGGDGIEDYIVFISSEGEAVVFQGFDPTLSSDFRMVGSFFIGKPVGPRCTDKYGGDLVVFTQAGVALMSQLLQSATLGRNEALSMKIQKAFADAAFAYQFSTGWQIINYPDRNALLVNLPAGAGLQKQYVMNTITKAWTAFEGWTANCFAQLGTSLYYGGADEVVQCWTGTNDKDVAITGYVQQAYNNFRIAGNKHIQLTRLNIATSGRTQIQASYRTDFGPELANSQTLLGEGGGTLWDSAVWDSSAWGGSISELQTLWIHIDNKPGYFLSLRLRAQSSDATFTWTATDLILKSGGAL